jgi:peptidylprolyl isomerase
MMARTRRLLTATAATMVLVAGGCSSDDAEDVQTGAEETGTAEDAESGDEADGTPDGTPDGATCRSGEDARDVAAPEFDAPDAPTDELEITDLVEGCGEEIPEGEVAQVEVNYAGKAESTGEVFDSSWDRNTPVAFPVGAGQLIAGWDEGLVGMNEGGRRMLLIPGDLAYGPQGNPPDIGPDDTLVFVIDLLAIES